MMNILEEVRGCQTIGISGHIRPDGDCIGSCLAAYNYLEEHYPDVNIETYKQKTLENLQNPITYNPNEVGSNLGVYKTKSSSDAAYVPGHTPTFKQKVNNANTTNNKAVPVKI